MGKAQSKRSVDITTETKKGADDEITEKMEKIEDLDKKEAINGDAALEEKPDIEKNEVENDKDMTTEKNVDTQTSGDLTEASNSVETPKEEIGSATAEEISPLADEIVKKSKKEKVKKKWSFRNISFGKKDKQKPSKSEETVEDETTAASGAETDEKPLKDDSQKEKSLTDVKGNSTEHHENGNATQEELNGTEHNELKPFEEKSNDLTANLTNNTTTDKSGPVQSETIAESSDVSEKTEVTTVTNTTNFETTISENISTAEASKSENEKSEESNATEQESQKVDVINNASNDTSTDKKMILTDATNELSASTNGEVLEKIHQNGDNIDQEVVEQSKAQIEVNFNTDNKVSAATLDSFPSTSINPSNAQIHNQDLNTTAKNADKHFEISCKDSSVLKITGTEENNILCSFRENVSTIEDIDSNKQIESTEMIEIDMSAMSENISEEPSPPPLPISPPPSQVSVFAFTNNAESVKDSISINNSETVCPLIEENNKIIPSHSEVLPDSTNYDDIRENIKEFEETTTNDNNELNEDVQNNCLKEQMCISKEELQENMYTHSLLGNFDKKEEFSIAAEVIDEIADKAAEIVSLQVETNKNIQEKNTLQQTDELEKGNEEDINDKTVLELENIVDDNELAEGNNASECRKDESSKLLLEPSIALNNKTSDTVTENSLIISASDATQQVQNELLFLRVEDHFNPTKEFGNAKDLKDNAAAAEITQDVSVTCE